MKAAGAKRLENQWSTNFQHAVSKAPDWRFRLCPQPSQLHSTCWVQALSDPYQARAQGRRDT